MIKRKTYKDIFQEKSVSDEAIEEAGELALKNIYDRIDRIYQVIQYLDIYTQTGMLFFPSLIQAPKPKYSDFEIGFAFAQMARKGELIITKSAP